MQYNMRLAGKKHTSNTNKDMSRGWNQLHSPVTLLHDFVRLVYCFLSVLFIFFVSKPRPDSVFAISFKWKEKFDEGGSTIIRACLIVCSQTAGSLSKGEWGYFLCICLLGRILIPTFLYKRGIVDQSFQVEGTMFPVEQIKRGGPLLLLSVPFCFLWKK